MSMRGAFVGMPSKAPRCGAQLDRLCAGRPAAAVAAAAAIVLPAGRARAAAMLLALVLFPVLILGDQWHSAQIVDLRDDAGAFVALGVAARPPASLSPPFSTAGRF